ncbi:hypothetical protein [Nonomuraea sp. NPDC049607]|uniref:hypothetical protein n=1 Tax=Nonomuraea sp. NPDC049607 TaxID=3154732 RepID=UPI0034483CF8
MSGTHRSAARAASSPSEGGGRRGRALMAAGVLLGTLMLATAGALMGDTFNSPGLDPVHWPHDARRTSGEPGPVATDSRRPVAVRSERAAVASGPVADRPAKTATGPAVGRTGPFVAGSTPPGGSTPSAVQPEGGRGTRRPHSTVPGPAATAPGRTPAPSPSRPHGSLPGPTPTPSWSTGPAASDPPSHPHGTPPGRVPSRTHGPKSRT